MRVGVGRRRQLEDEAQIAAFAEEENEKKENHLSPHDLVLPALCTPPGQGRREIVGNSTGS